MTEDVALDMAATIAPRSDQLNYDDVSAAAITVTVDQVRILAGEQPVEIHLVEYPGRPFKPSKTVRRVLVFAWGPKASKYVGRRMTLYGDPTVRFGGAVVGGIRVSHLSHIDKKLTIPVTVTRGKRSPYVVEPLVEETPPEPDYDRVEQWAAKHEKVDALQGALSRMQAVDTDRARAACARIQERISELRKSGGEQ